MTDEEKRDLVVKLLGKEALSWSAEELDAKLRETDWYKTRVKLIEEWDERR